MYTINNLNVFSDTLDGATLNQMHEAMNHDWVIRGALMPDAHLGYGLPIGGVVMTKDVVVPSWVGYDIGCGMAAVKTQFLVDQITMEERWSIYNRIVDTVPLGVGVYRKKPIMTVRQVRFVIGKECSDFMDSAFDQKAVANCGSLGSGNHFIEIGYDETKHVWIIIHSGSRGIGHACATHYMGLAQPNSGSKEGSFPLDVNSAVGKDYIKDLNFMLEFALINRAVLLNDVLNCMYSVLVDGYQEVPFSYKSEKNMVKHDGRILEFINRNHNHAESKWFKGDPSKEYSGYLSNMTEMWVHRKGATHAEEGMMGVIPGNMRDGSFIVQGKGADVSLCSSSHGAGRILGRKEAKRSLNTIDFVDTMKDVVCGVNNDPGGLIDEAPDAYKNIFTVMEEQSDLVEVKHHVLPIINVKR